MRPIILSDQMYPPKKNTNKPLYPAQNQCPAPLYSSAQRQPNVPTFDRSRRPLSPRYRDISNSKDKHVPPTVNNRNNRPATGVFGSSTNPVNSRGLSALNKYQKSTATTQLRSNFTQANAYQRAPANQFKKYLDDSDNVFWQNSTTVRNLKIVRFVKYSLLVLLLVLIVSYFLIGRISSYPKERCPHNAECGVFVKCKKGYILDNNNCVIDPSIKNEAESICLAVVEQLKLEYGNLDCQLTSNHSPALNQTQSELPTRRIRDVFAQFRVEDSILREQIYEYLSDVSHQQQYGYRLFTNIIQPTIKIHSVRCKVQLFTKTNHFIGFVVALVVIAILGGYLIRHMVFKKQARMAYQYLRLKTLSSQAILIEEHKPVLIKMVKNWNQEMWQEIDRLRCDERMIVFYYEHEQLYWRVFKQL